MMIGSPGTDASVAMDPLVGCMQAVFCPIRMSMVAGVDVSPGNTGHSLGIV